MSPNLVYTFDILIVLMGLFHITYVIYGRTKNKALIGGYKPGKPGHTEFRKFVDSNRNLAIAVVATAFFTISAVLEAFRVLQGPSEQHSVLVVAPVFIVLLSSVVFFVTSRILPKE